MCVIRTNVSTAGSTVTEHVLMKITFRVLQGLTTANSISFWRPDPPPG